jgi:hypothetical protein
MNINNWIEYPEYDKAWIAWETTSSYLVHKIKRFFDDEGKILSPRLWDMETEWILKTEFNYKIKNNDKEGTKISQ